jgi:hypothetical protein
MGGARGTYGGRRYACIVLVGRPKRKRPLGRSNCRYENNIETDLKERGSEGVAWVDLV